MDSSTEGQGLSDLAESHSTRGPIDGDKLYDFLQEFERLEPLATGDLDDMANPTLLQLWFDDGVGEATHARLDVKWTVQDDYNIHYTDSMSRNLRWDVHPHDFPVPPDERHFHPPPDASNAPDSVEASCIEVSEVVLVARAVQKLWRLAYESGTFDEVNAATNPP